MKERFIYVFNKDDKKKMEDLGCRLFKEDERNSLFIFISSVDDILKFDRMDDIPDYIVTDIISF